MFSWEEADIPIKSERANGSEVLEWKCKWADAFQLYWEKLLSLSQSPCGIVGGKSFTLIVLYICTPEWFTEIDSIHLQEMTDGMRDKGWKKTEWVEEDEGRIKGQKLEPTSCVWMLGRCNASHHQNPQLSDPHHQNEEQDMCVSAEGSFGEIYSRVDRRIRGSREDNDWETILWEHSRDPSPAFWASVDSPH